MEFSGAYPGWEPDPIQNSLKFFNPPMKTFFKKPDIRAIHAGLECGIIGAKYPGLDMVSIGPTICHPHSPDEAVSIRSVQKFWRFLSASLEKI